MVSVLPAPEGPKSPTTDFSAVQRTSSVNPGYRLTISTETTPSVPFGKSCRRLPRSRRAAGRRARAAGVEGTRSRPRATDPAARGGAQPQRGSARVPRGPAIPAARARRLRRSALSGAYHDLEDGTLVRRRAATAATPPLGGRGRKPALEPRSIHRGVYCERRRSRVSKESPDASDEARGDAVEGARGRACRGPQGSGRARTAPGGLEAEREGLVGRRNHRPSDGCRDRDGQAHHQAHQGGGSRGNARAVASRPHRVCAASARSARPGGRAGGGEAVTRKGDRRADRNHEGHARAEPTVHREARDAGSAPAPFQARPPRRSRPRAVVGAPTTTRRDTSRPDPRRQARTRVSEGVTGEGSR